MPGHYGKCHGAARPMAERTGNQRKPEVRKIPDATCEGLEGEKLHM